MDNPLIQFLLGLIIATCGILIVRSCEHAYVQQSISVPTATATASVDTVQLSTQEAATVMASQDVMAQIMEIVCPKVFDENDTSKSFLDQLKECYQIVSTQNSDQAL